MKPLTINFSDNDISKAEKTLKSKCVFIDWRYNLYHFDNGKVLDTEAMLEAIYPDK